MENIFDENIMNDAEGEKKRKSRKVSVRIDDDMAKFIEDMSEQYELTKSNVLRIIIAGRINKFTDHSRYIDKETEREIKSALYFAA